jgi:putative redox protein
MKRQRLFNRFLSKQMIMKTTTTWSVNDEFESVQNGHSIKLDGSAKNGFSPKALLLSGLAACTGVDFVDILEKMRVKIDSLVIDAEAEQTDTTPKVFKDIKLIYRVKTVSENKPKLIKAIELSLEKYCGVAAMLRKNSAITYELVLV